jgi:D-alanine--D-alanine ligase
MRIGVVRTVGSPCRCAESVSVGLQALGHEFLLTDSGEIEIHAPALAEECDLIIDHTDTYCGRGLYRAFVRLLLENCCAKVVGAPAHACFVADNKAAAKQILADAGIPVPPGILIQSDVWRLPEWLRPPLVIKPAFEHMSRGVSLVNTEQEAYAATARLFEALRQPILVESFIPGRELAVSLIGNSSTIQVLPALEWQSGTDILDEDFKLMDPDGEKHQAVQAHLEGGLKRELEDLTRHAFHSLNLRDYARFDLRLSPDGCLFFLEANTSPSLEPLEAFALSAEWAGLDYVRLVDRLLSTARRRYDSSHPEKPADISISLPSGSVELTIPEGVPPPAESTIELARVMDVRKGEDVLEMGCGSGLLSIAAAKLGARQVIATDLDPKALHATTNNAQRNGVKDRIEIRAGSWYQALTAELLQLAREKQFDVIIATPPQTPGPHPFGPKYGGPDGARHLARIIERAPDFLKPEQGRLWLMAISLANPRELWKMLRQGFAEVTLVHKTERLFTADEYEALDRGLFDYLSGLRSSGISDFAEADEGRYYFHNLFIRAAKPRKI